MKKQILTIFIILLSVTVGMNFVSAENDTVLMTSEDEEELKIKNEEERTGDIVGASENGHYNISFDDGYNGYCINYGDHEASKGHEFIVKDTSEAVNHNNKQSIGNELKTFFVEFYDIAMKDKIKTQHIIWYFSDDFKSSRYDPSLIEDIKKVSSEKIIPDHGAIKKISSNTFAIFDFEMLESTNPGHQNFFAYKITFKDIMEFIKNETGQNSTNSTNETVKNESDTKTQENEDTHLKQEPRIVQTENINKIQYESAKNNQTHDNSEKKDSAFKSNLKKHVTGYNFIPALIILLFGTLLLVKYTRD